MMVKKKKKRAAQKQPILRAEVDRRAAGQMDSSALLHWSEMTRAYNYCKKCLVNPPLFKKNHLRPPGQFLLFQQPLSKINPFRGSLNKIYPHLECSCYTVLDFQCIDSIFPAWMKLYGWIERMWEDPDRASAHRSHRVNLAWLLNSNSLLKVWMQVGRQADKDYHNLHAHTQKKTNGQCSLWVPLLIVILIPRALSHYAQGLLRTLCSALESW